PSSMAPNSTANAKRVCLSVSMNDPSPAVKPAMNAAAASVSGRTVVMGATEASSADWLPASWLRTRRRAVAVLDGTLRLVCVQGIAPELELLALGAREQERLCERNGHGVMALVRGDSEGAARQPPLLPSRSIGDRPGTKKRPK